MSNTKLGFGLLAAVALGGFLIYKSGTTSPQNKDKFNRPIALEPKVNDNPEKPLVPFVSIVKTVKENPPPGEIPPPPKDTPAAAVAIRETKPEGTSYNCAFQYSCAGTGHHHAWFIQGKAHFEAEQELQWHETVEKNDGSTIVLLREFTGARSNVLVADSKMGINDKIRGIAPKAGGVLTTLEILGLSAINPFVGVSVGTVLVATTFADEECLKNWPFLGGIVKSYADNQAQGVEKKIQVFQKSLDGLHGKKIRITITNGKLKSAEYTDGSMVDETVTKWATRMSPYADYNLVPETSRMIAVGEEKDYGVRQFFEGLGVEFEADQKVDGVVRLGRKPDGGITQERFAVFEGRGLHLTQFISPLEGGSIEAEGAPEMIHTKFVYGSKGNYVAESFVNCSEATAKTTKDGLFWGQNDDLSGNFSFAIRYSCTPEVGDKR